MGSTAVHEERWAECMRCAQDGDAVAYHQLLTEIRPVLLQFLRVRTRDVTVAEDILQEVLLAIHRARHTYDPARPFRPWMFAIAQHRFIDAYRRRQRTTAREIDDEFAVDRLADPTDFEPQLDAGLTETMAAALAALPARQREVVTLLKVRGLSVKEVAVAVGISEANVKVTAHRAYKAMRGHLEGWADEDG